MLKFDCCFATDVGKVRTNNEDNFYICGSYKRTPEELRYKKNELIYKEGLFAVCDGMGGEEYGEKASLIAVEELKKLQSYNFNKRYTEYINNVNQKICNLIEENNGTRSGTTLALTYINDENAVCYNIGDSRIYLLRKGVLTQISEDHTRVQQMIKMGAITKEQALTHKDRHVLTQHLGIFPDELIVSPFISDTLKIRNDDILLLCSDGLTDMITDNEIELILKNSSSAKDSAENLINRALANGGKDNVTVGIIKCIGKKKSLLERICGK